LGPIVLLDPNSSTNVEGRNLAGRLSDHASCYFWFFQPQADKDWHPAAACPVCREPLDRYESGIFLQLLCPTDRLVLVG